MCPSSNGIGQYGNIVPRQCIEKLAKTHQDFVLEIDLVAHIGPMTDRVSTAAHGAVPSKPTLPDKTSPAPTR